jgi:hypothetical protein
VRSERRVIQQAYWFELDPNQKQRVLLAKSVGASRYVYNWGLAESKRQRTALAVRLAEAPGNRCEYGFEPG